MFVLSAAQSATTTQSVAASSILSVGWWSDFCAVLGFAVSIILAIREVRKYRTSLSVCEAIFYLYLMKNDENVHYCISLVVENNSSSAISITSIALIEVDGKNDLAVPTETILAIGSAGKIITFESTSFPINLQAYESSQAVLMFHLTEQERLSLGLPVPDDLDTAYNELYKYSKPSRPQSSDQRVKFHLSVRTSRKPVTVSGEAGFIRISEKLSTLNSKLEMLSKYEKVGD